MFEALFNPIIQEYHGFKPEDKHPPTYFGDLEKFGDLDPEGDLIVSTRIRCARSLTEYPFNACLTEAQYKEIESKIIPILNSLDGDLQGTYYRLDEMDKVTQQQLINEHFLFKQGDRFLEAANACRFWPVGRGIFYNDEKTFLVWVNEEDHLRIISMQEGANVKEVYDRLIYALELIEEQHSFAHSERLGYLTACPTNLGTTIRASVHIILTKLATDKAKLEEIASRHHLQIRGTSGEHSESENSIYDISNKRRLGITEEQAILDMYNGVKEIIEFEKEA